VGVGAVMQVTGIPSPRVRMFSQIAFTESPCCCASERKTRRSSALVTFAQLFGGVLGIGVCGAVFANELASDLVKYAPDAPFALVRDSISAIYPLPVQQQADVIHGYVSGEIRAGIAFDKELEELMKGQMEMDRRLRELAQN
jgi:hypothetical protein